MYGQTFNDSQASAWNAGINEEVSLKFFGLTKVETANFQGNVLDMVYEKNGQEFRDRMFQVNEENLKTRKVKENGVERDQTDEEAKIEAYGNFNSRVKHVVCQFVDEAEFTKVTSTAKNFDEFVVLCATILPQNYSEIKGKLIMGYNNKGYLEIPRAMWVTGDFLSLDGRPLKVSNRIKLEKEEKAAEETATTTNTKW